MVYAFSCCEGTSLPTNVFCAVGIAVTNQLLSNYLTMLDAFQACEKRLQNIQPHEAPFIIVKTSAIHKTKRRILVPQELSGIAPFSHRRNARYDGCAVAEPKTAPLSEIGAPMKLNSWESRVGTKCCRHRASSKRNFPIVSGMAQRAAGAKRIFGAAAPPLAVVN